LEQDRQTALLHYDVPRPASLSIASSSSSSLAAAAAAATATAAATQPAETGGPAEGTNSNVNELFTSRDRRRDVTMTSDELSALLTEQDGEAVTAEVLSVDAYARA